MKILSKIKALFRKNRGETVIVEREQFANEMREKFRGNIDLLKAIEESMNRNVKKDEYVHLTE